MNRFNFCAFFIILLTLHATAQDGVSWTRWNTGKVIIDGNSNDWIKPFNFYDDESSLLFALSNDSKDLYICFTGKDERKMYKLMKAGWSIELFSKEKKKKFDASIVFPAEEIATTPEKTSDPAKPERPDFKNTVAGYKLNLQVVKTKGFSSNNGEIHLLNNNGINIAVGEDSTHEILVELAIPLKELFAESEWTLNEEMSLEVTVNALPKPAHTNGNGGSGSGHGGGHMGGMGAGGGHMGGGGRHGGGSSMGENTGSFDRNSLFEKSGFKQKFRLTDK